MRNFCLLLSQPKSDRWLCYRSLMKKPIRLQDFRSRRYNRPKLTVSATYHNYQHYSHNRLKMENKIAWVSWKCGQYSDVYRSTIIDPSPLREGQKVKVVWGKTRKEYAAVVACYPLKEVVKQTSMEQSKLPPRQARAKRKLVSLFISVNSLTRTPH